jgi:hypothetical protein
MGAATDDDGSSSGSIYKVDGFGQIKDILRQPDFSWFSDFTVLSDGHILAW